MSERILSATCQVNLKAKSFSESGKTSAIRRKLRFNLSNGDDCSAISVESHLFGIGLWVPPHDFASPA